MSLCLVPPFEVEQFYKTKAGMKQSEAGESSPKLPSADQFVGEVKLNSKTRTPTLEVDAQCR